MEFEYSDRCKELQGKLLKFMDEHIYPNEKAFTQEVYRNGKEKGNRWIPTQLI
jgi:acyl-CoA dehydrogenase